MASTQVITRFIFVLSCTVGCPPQTAPPNTHAVHDARLELFLGTTAHPEHSDHAQVFHAQVIHAQVIHAQVTHAQVLHAQVIHVGWSINVGAPGQVS